MSFLLLSHRGACRQAPENTLAAFRLALEAGCHGSECDVQLSCDGALVVFHDETLERLTGQKRAVPQLTWPELATLRLRGTRAQADPAMITPPPAEGFPLGTRVEDAASLRLASAGGGVIPTLEEVLRLHASRHTYLFAELKYFSEAHTPRKALGAAVITFADTQQPNERFHVISFDEALVQWIKQLRPMLRTGLVFDDRTRFARVQAACPSWADVLLPRADCVDEALVAWAKEVGRPLYAWVADDEAAIERLTQLGVDGVLTNEPSRLVAWAKRHGR